MSRSAFDLEHAVAAWRRLFAHNRAFTPDDLDELEGHLRDRVAEFVENGLAPEAAFRAATQRMGPYDTASAEYRKVYGGKIPPRTRLADELSWRGAMLKNYGKIAWRNVRQHTGYTALNIAGLATGLAVCLLIALFVQHELSYDRFHANADRTYRVVSGLGGEQRLSSSARLAPTLVADFPEVEYGLRISMHWPEVLVRHEGELRYEDQFFFVDSTFFDVFSFPLVHGDPATALTRPFTVVISETMARNYFGDADPLGQTLNIKGPWDAHDFEITGVARDAPSNSHFAFNFLASFASRYYAEAQPENIDAWWIAVDQTYVVLAEGTDIERLTAAMPTFFERHRSDWLEYQEKVDLTDVYTFQPLPSIHLYSDLMREWKPGGDVRTLYVFSTVALLILLIGCINYMNLATARAATRAREVGVRKVVGAHRRQLMGQFLSESALHMVAALLVALLLVHLGRPLFSDLLQIALALDAGWLLAIALGISLGVGALAGLYPALMLSRFQPVQVLKGKASGRASDAWFRHGLVVVQFAASVVLIVGTITIQRQLDYMQEKTLGMTPEQVVTVSTRGALRGSQFDAFKSEVLQRPDIVGVTSVSEALPTTPEQMGAHWLTRPTVDQRGPYAHGISVGMDFLETMEIPLLEGRDLTPGDLEHIRSRVMTPVLVNRAAVEAFGWEEPLGKEFGCCRRTTPRVVGVVENFHYQSLKEEIAPLVLSPTWSSRHVLIRVRTEDLPATLDAIQAQWEAVAPAGYPFAFTFMDERFDAVYDAEQRLARAFGLFSGLAILIACLGLFGLAAFMAQRRTKEIGIRKVLGASVSNIVALLSRDFVGLVAIALAVAAPLSYVLMQHWLRDFPYRIELSGTMWVASGVLVVAIALLTVSYQSVRAALADPVESLRTE
ncbi:MAG: ABC transporter permease [Bacteroidota bacterium]